MTRSARCRCGGPEAQDFLIRPAREGDADALFELEGKIFGDDAYSMEKFRRLLGFGSKIKVFVATREGYIQGYGAVTVQRAGDTLHGDFGPLDEVGVFLAPEVRVGYLKSLAVRDDPFTRRRGIGTALVRKRLNWLAGQGIEHVFCYAWPKGDFWAVGKKLGFQQINGWRKKRYNDGSVGTLCYHRLQPGSLKTFNLSE